MAKRALGAEHAEWFSLIEIDGPFFSLPILCEVFPQGLESVDSDIRRELRLAHEQWLEDPTDPRKHVAWIEVVLERLLSFVPRATNGGTNPGWTLERFGGAHAVPPELVHSPATLI